MTYTKKIICLANSIKKYPSRCIAGKEWDGQKGRGWIRPVTEIQADEGAIPLSMTRYSDGSFVQVLDIIEIPLSSHIPKSCQVENYLAPHSVWIKCGRIGWEDLQSLLDAQNDLWGIGHSSRYGKNDSISAFEAAHLNDSLRFIQPVNFRILVKTEDIYGSGGNTKRGIRGVFSHHGTNYILKITDPYFTEKINDYTLDESYHINDVFICVSVSDKLGENHYKLIASIIIPDRC